MRVADRRGIEITAASETAVAFIDAHFMMALAGAGDRTTAGRLIAAQRGCAAG
jgi:hypothetical protein